MRDKIQLQGIPTPVIWVPRPFLLQQETTGASLSTGAGLSQLIQIPATLSVTKVELYLQGAASIEIGFSTDVGPVGPSASAVSLSSASWVTFLWTGARPLLAPGDIYLVLALTSPPHANWFYGTASGGILFQDSTRCAYHLGTTPRPDDDFCFRIYP